MANEQMYSDPNLYNDGSGRGAVIAQPVSTPQTAMKNMSTLRPAGAQTEEDEEQKTNESIDYLESLFNGENLSEEFMNKAAVIFEAAINEKVALVEQSILEAAKEVIQEQVNANTQALTEQLDGYLNYVITEWMEENKVAVERGLRTEIAENFMLGLKELLEETFIDVPEEKFDIVDELSNANEELQEQLNTEIRKNIELQNEITARLCAESFMEVSQGLTDTEVEKLAKLSEGLEFGNVEQYTEKVKVLKESYFNRSNRKNTLSEQQNLVEETTDPNAMRNVANPQMSALVEAMSRINKNKNTSNQPKVNENSNAGKLLNMINPNISTDQYI